MTSKGFFKFLAGCGAATLLLVGCGGGGGGGGGGTTEIKTSAQAAAATTAVVTALSGGFTNLSSMIQPPAGPVAPLLALGFAKNHAEKVRAIQAMKVKFAAKAKALAPVPTTTDLTCNGGGSGTETIVYDAVTGNYSDTITANNCKVITDPVTGDFYTINGTTSYADSYNGDFTTYTTKSGDGDGRAEASDYSFKLTSGGVTETFLMDDNSTGTYGTGDYSADWSYNYTDSSKGQLKLSVSDNSMAVTFTFNGRSSGTESWVAVDKFYKSTETFAGSINFSVNVAGQTIGLAFAADTTGIWEEHGDFGTAGYYTLNSPNGTLTVKMTYPDAPNCANGTFAVETLAPIREEYDASSSMNAIVSGRLLINDNTEVSFSPLNLITVTLDGTIVPEADHIGLDTYMANQAGACPLFDTASL